MNICRCFLMYINIGFNKNEWISQVVAATSTWIATNKMQQQQQQHSRDHISSSPISLPLILSSTSTFTSTYYFLSLKSANFQSKTPLSFYFCIILRHIQFYFFVDAFWTKEPTAFIICFTLKLGKLYLFALTCIYLLSSSLSLPVALAFLSFD